MKDGFAEGEAGLSVIETLVAFLIFAVGILAVMTMFSESQRLMGEAEQRRAALELARQRLEQKLGSPYHELTTAHGLEVLENGRIRGEDERDGIVRTWTVERAQPEEGIVLIRVTTRWTQRGQERSMTLVGLKADGRVP